MTIKEELPVTGATSGMDFVAKRLGNDGYTVVLNGIDDSQGATCLEQLVGEGINAEYVGFDVTDEAVNKGVSIGRNTAKLML